MAGGKRDAVKGVPSTVRARSRFFAKRVVSCQLPCGIEERTQIALLLSKLGISVEIFYRPLCLVKLGALQTVGSGSRQTFAGRA